MSQLMGDRQHEVVAWLKAEIVRQRAAAKIHEDLVRTEESFVYVPVHVRDGSSIADKATILQNLEDAWNNDDAHHGTNLLLVPTAD